MTTNRGGDSGIMPKKESKGAGRPIKVKLDLDAVEKMASYGSSVREIAAVLGVDEHIIRRRGKEAMEKGSMNLNVRLRKAQIDLALGGNAVMCIWLGKQRLNQSDNGTFEEDELLDSVSFDLDTGAT